MQRWIVKTESKNQYKLNRLSFSSIFEKHCWTSQMVSMSLHWATLRPWIGGSIAIIAIWYNTCTCIFCSWCSCVLPWPSWRILWEFGLGPVEQQTPGKDTGHVGYSLITWDTECALFARLKQHLFFLAASLFYFSMAFCSKERKGQKKNTNAQLLMKHSQVERTCMISFKKMSISTHLNKKTQSNVLFTKYLRKWTQIIT